MNQTFATKMAEIWCPGTLSKDVWTIKFSVLYPLYSQSYGTFIGNYKNSDGDKDTFIKRVGMVTEFIAK